MARSQTLLSLDDSFRFLKRQVRRHPGLASQLKWPVARGTVHLRHLRLRYLYGGRILDGARVNDWLAQQIEHSLPTAAGKLGTVEFGLIRVDSRSQRSSSGGVSFPPELRRLAFNNAGIFPDSDESIEVAVREIREAMGKLDVYVVWGLHGEKRLISTEHLSARVFSPIDALEPWHWENPWTSALAWKRVLVIHPFAKSIESQYRTVRPQIWPDQPLLLPDFDLVTIPMPLSPSLVPPFENSWMERLKRLRAEMELVDFDVAIVGAGGMSLPLVAHGRHLGKVAVHLGGATQLLFGIRGRRWDRDGVSLFNPSWIRPLPEETPESFRSVEEGCYW